MTKEEFLINMVMRVSWSNRAKDILFGSEYRTAKKNGRGWTPTQKMIEIAVEMRHFYYDVVCLDFKRYESLMDDDMRKQFEVNGGATHDVCTFIEFLAKNYLAKSMFGITALFSAYSVALTPEMAPVSGELMSREKTLGSFSMVQNNNEDREYTLEECLTRVMGLMLWWQLHRWFYPADAVLKITTDEIFNLDPPRLMTYRLDDLNNQAQYEKTLVDAIYSPVNRHFKSQTAIESGNKDLFDALYTSRDHMLYLCLLSSPTFINDLADKCGMERIVVEYKEPE